mmetsp:Transcript_1912/g.7257  ORF Transcript_1912/g.7257 Transcript_1912/m.7257 type:complete len:200 (+) Transcript_1912:5242-5841(+)
MFEKLSCLVNKFRLAGFAQSRNHRGIDFFIILEPLNRDVEQVPRYVDIPDTNQRVDDGTVRGRVRVYAFTLHLTHKPESISFSSTLNKTGANGGIPDEGKLALRFFFEHLIKDFYCAVPQPNTHAGINQRIFRYVIWTARIPSHLREVIECCVYLPCPTCTLDERIECRFVWVDLLSFHLFDELVCFVQLTASRVGIHR